jgi:outer membrane receptor protein involved in Fe transport
MVALAVLALPSSPHAAGGTAAPSPDPEYVEVTTSRIPEDVEVVPASVTLITREDLANRGATDLRSALSLAAGVDISPGGDAGPASSVPEFWGLREFDAFLLVVDGVPWGGAFNPSLATIDLADVDRIEVVRGAAPVMYGATSFVGVIQILRRPAGTGETSVSVGGGTYGSGSLGASVPLPKWGAWSSTLSGDLEQRNFSDDQTEIDRGHILWRGTIPAGAGRFRLDADAIWLGQDPASPQPRVGRVLTFLVPIDSNHNPADSHLNERRLFAVAGYERPFASTAHAGSWTTTLSVTRSDQGSFRGFLTDVTTTAPNAHGFRQGIATNDLHFDTHVDLRLASSVRFVAGIDHLHGLGSTQGGDFDYFVALNGSHPPDPGTLPSQADISIRDRREFSGLYAFTEWTPAARWLFELGARLNRTAESRDVDALDFGSGLATIGHDRSDVTRGSGAAGVTWTAWQRSSDALHVYADYRDTYKPAAIDFGLDSEPEILAPETARSYEIGAKARLLKGTLQPELSLFRMDFENLVVMQDIGGLPSLTNAGRERFRGAEASIAWFERPHLQWRAAWSFHDARYREFVTDFGGVPTQLAGNHLEMSPRSMGAVGVVYAPESGWTGTAQVNVVGSRYLDRRNTALAAAYTTVSAGIGYRTRRWELRLDGSNLNNQRPPVSESELGDSQYYLLPPLRVMLSAIYRTGGARGSTAGAPRPSSRPSDL